MSSESLISPTVAEFQRRRDRTWRFLRWWLVVAAGLMGTLVVFLLTKHLDDRTVSTGVALALAILTALVGAGLTVLRIYRCPGCNQVPAADLGAMDEGGKGARRNHVKPVVVSELQDATAVTVRDRLRARKSRRTPFCLA